MKRHSQLWAVAVAALAATGCAQGLFATKGSGVVTGTVTYRERIALPADTVVDVRLTDVTRPDSVATVVAESKFSTEGRQVPIPFELRYDPKEILDTHIYVVRALIRSGRRMLFATDTAYPVITQGKPMTAELMLVRVGE